MNIRIATQADVETLFDIRISVFENHQSRENLAAIGITPQSLAEMLVSSSLTWIASEDGTDVASRWRMRQRLPSTAIGSPSSAGGVAEGPGWCGHAILRRNLTPAKASVWRALKNSGLDGKKFRRRHGIGPYVAPTFIVRKVASFDGVAHEGPLK